MSVGTEWWRCSSEEYHAHPAISRSEFVDFVKCGPLYYKQRYVDKTLIDKPSDAMRLGTALHALVLEGRKPSDDAVIIPRDVLNADGHRKGGKWTAFRDANDGARLVTQAEADAENGKIVAMRDSIMRCPAARKLIEGCDLREVGVKWIDEETGLAMRCRFDGVNHGRIIDIKSTSGGLSDREWSNTVANYLYHIQDQWYSRGYMEAIGESPSDFLFVAVQSDEPHETRVFSLSARFRELAGAKLAKKLPELAKRLDLDWWDRTKTNEITEIDPPRFLETDDQWED